MLITKVNCPADKVAIKCPYAMEPEYVSVHNTANDASAMSEISYMLGNNKEVSFHYAVDDYRAVQGLDENRNGWHSGDGNGTGNRKSIGIEICYSKSGGEKFVKAEENAAILVAYILKRYGWGIDRVKKHQDWSGKYCPHRTLDMGWDRFVKMIETALNGEENKSTEVSNQVDVFYRVKTQKHGWLPEVKNLEDYAGWEDSPIVGLAMRTDKGSLRYRATTVGGKVLGWVTGCDINDYINGWAGNNEPIATIEAEYFTPDDIVESSGYKYLYYKVNDYPYQIDLIRDIAKGLDGYAGVKGQPITKFQAEIK